MTERGLVSREVVSLEHEMVSLKEVWDVTVPGCPVIAMDPGVTTVTRWVRMRPEEYAELTGESK